MSKAAFNMRCKRFHILGFLPYRDPAVRGVRPLLTTSPSGPLTLTLSRRERGFVTLGVVCIGDFFDLLLSKPVVGQSVGKG